MPPADGPFPPGSLGYLEDTGDPEYDLDLAQSEMNTCVAELGTDTIEFAYSTTNDPFNVESNSLIISMWDEAFGDTVQAQITPIEQGQYIGLALVGQFNALGWRSHSGLDPDIQRTATFRPPIRRLLGSRRGRSRAAPRPPPIRGCTERSGRKCSRRAERGECRTCLSYNAGSLQRHGMAGQEWVVVSLSRSSPTAAMASSALSAQAMTLIVVQPASMYGLRNSATWAGVPWGE